MPRAALASAESCSVTDDSTLIVLPVQEGPPAGKSLDPGVGVAGAHGASWPDELEAWVD